jgi:hypothetical protein
VDEAAEDIVADDPALCSALHRPAGHWLAEPEAATTAFGHYQAAANHFALMRRLGIAELVRRGWSYSDRCRIGPVKGRDRQARPLGGGR